MNIPTAVQYEKLKQLLYTTIKIYSVQELEDKLKHQDYSIFIELQSDCLDLVLANSEIFISNGFSYQTYDQPLSFIEDLSEAKSFYSSLMVETEVPDDYEGSMEEERKTQKVLIPHSPEPDEKKGELEEFGTAYENTGDHDNQVWDEEKSKEEIEEEELRRDEFVKEEEKKELDSQEYYGGETEKQEKAEDRGSEVNDRYKPEGEGEGVGGQYGLNAEEEYYGRGETEEQYEERLESEGMDPNYYQYTQNYAQAQDSEEDKHSQGSGSFQSIPSDQE